MKKILLFGVIIFMLLTSLASCIQKDSVRFGVAEKAKETLDGKKILIAGCSYNFYGKMVNNVYNNVTDQASRINDTGYFYELCRQNGANVEVTNWCFGNHDLSDLFGTSCAADRECGNGHNHLADLVDRDYDYVSMMDVMRPTSLTEDEYVEEIKSYMKLFTDVNPDCKFIYSVPCGAYWYKGERLYEHVKYLDKIAELPNVTVVDWGRLVLDLINLEAKVEDSDLFYYEKSFIVSDGYHPNLLSGYINAVMTYCAITGETAIGQPTNLENGTEPASALKYKKENFVKNFYKGSTNFPEIMDSETDIRGIQQLIDEYLEKKTYLDHS